MKYYYLNPQPQLFDNHHVQPCTKADIMEFLDNVDEFGLDTETTGLNFQTDTLLCVTLGNEEKAFFIDARVNDLEFLKPYLESDGRVKIMANAGFDYKFLYRKGIVMNKVFDVITTDLVLNQDEQTYMNSLSDLVQKYLDEFMSKSVRNSFIGMRDEPFTDAQVIYACDDIKYLPRLKSHLVSKAIDMKTHVLDLENAMTLVIADMEMEGVRLDQDKWKALANKAMLKRQEAEVVLDRIIEEDKIFAAFRHKYVQADMFVPFEDLRKVNVMWTSPKQVLKVLQTVVPDLKSADANELSEHKSKHKIIEAYLEYSDWGKKASTYGLDFLKHLYPDGRIRTHFTPTVATGRMASKNPNMQNIPAEAEYRNCFVPNYDGWDFVSADFSGQELCIIAHGSQDPVWMKALEEDKDLHSICADLLFGEMWRKGTEPGCLYFEELNGKPFQQKCGCKGHKKLRDVVKTLNFGLAYGLTEHSFAQRMGISKENALALIEDYYRTFPNIKTYMLSLSAFAKKKGYMVTMPPFFRVRKFKEWKGYYTPKEDMGAIERKGRNTRIQGTGADMLKLALVLIRKHINQNKLRDRVRLVLTVHDEANTISRQDYTKQWKEELKNIMERAARVIVPSGIKAEPTVSLQWEK